MSENKDNTKGFDISEISDEEQIGKNADEEGYKIAKLIRLGTRELERQLNIKKTTNNR